MVEDFKTTRDASCAKNTSVCFLEKQFISYFRNFFMISNATHAHFVSMEFSFLSVALEDFECRVDIPRHPGVSLLVVHVTHPI